MQRVNRSSCFFSGKSLVPVSPQLRRGDDRWSGRSAHAFPRITEGILVPVIVFLALFPCAVCRLSAAATEQSLPMMRAIAPVRLPSEPGEKLVSDVTAAREVLEKFRGAGFEYAVWAVDSLPVKDDDIKPWVASCMDAFPASVIVALDAGLEKGKSSLDSDRLKLFFSALASVSSPPGRTAPDKVSILVNFTRMNNCECADNAADAIAATVGTAKLIRKISPKTFIWLFLEDCPKAASAMPDWLKAAGGLVDGYYVSRPHGWNASNKTAAAELEQVFQTGRKVLRAGFRYTCPRMRTGLKESLLANYRQRMPAYEQWITTGGYAGYSREIGDAVPEKISVNMILTAADTVGNGEGK